MQELNQESRTSTTQKYGLSFRKEHHGIICRAYRDNPLIIYKIDILYIFYGFECPDIPGYAKMNTAF
jgi:hypothetical protein